MRTNQEAYEQSAKWFDEGLEMVRFLSTVYPPGDLVIAVTRALRDAIRDGTLGPDNCAAVLAVALVRACERTTPRGN